MVKIVEVQLKESREGNSFCILKVEGGANVNFSNTTGQAFIETRTARILSSASYESCKRLLGTELPGDIKKVKCEPYKINTSTGKEITLDYKYQYVESDKIDDLGIELVD